MMKLSLMAAFFDTADDADRHTPLADAIAARWTDGEASVEHRRSSANFVFAVADEYILRFNHESERDPEYIEAELDCIEYLAAQGQSVAPSVRSRTGNRIERVENRLGVFHAVLFPALPGRQRSIDDLDEIDFARWGQALGELHAASLDLDVERPSWAEHLADMRGLIPLDESGAHGELDYIARELEDFGGGPDEFGLVHFDFEMDNVLWADDGRLGIIDFDDSAYYPFVADIALALRDLYDDAIAHIDLADERLQTFVAGYRQAKSLSDEALRQLPLFARLGNLMVFARQIWALGDGPEREEPQWTTQLRQALAADHARSRHEFAENPLRLFLS
ncbi:MAG: phosphotransferase [Candidatus Latescibacteria bacterium]|nr:phosphotransferase [Candidatus Latescibacterota bacterium]